MTQKKFSISAFLLFLAMLFMGISCTAFPEITESSSWSFRPGGETAGTVYIAPVQTDKAGGWSSVENEMSDLLHLFFMERSYRIVSESGSADFVVETKAREREFIRGWRTVSSLSLELYIKAGGGQEEGSGPALAAGKVMVQGGVSFSSSKTLSRMLKKAVNEALQSLETP
jgi:hypothetical protein